MSLQSDFKGAIARKDGLELTHCVFWNPDYKPILFEHITTLPFSTKQQKDVSQTISFIDGGEQTLFVSSSYLLGLVRVAASVWTGIRRKKIVAKEFIVFVNVVEQQYNITFYTKNGEEIIPFEDELYSTLSFQRTDYDIEEAFNTVRRYLELSFSRTQLHDTNMLVIDGSLRTFAPEEHKLIKQLQESAREKNVLVIGFQKTTSVHTNTKRSLAQLQTMFGTKEWMTSKLCENTNNLHPAILHALHLHPHSRHVFIIEVSEQQELRQEHFNALREQGKDPIFLGYPYGLIDADSIARVSDEEVRYMQLEVRKLLGENAKQLEEDLSSKDAHGILDSMKF